MNKVILSIVFILAFIPFFKENDRSLFEYEAVIYPNDILIPINWSKEKLMFYIKLYYRYIENNNIIFSENGFHVRLDFLINCSINYYDKRGRAYPKATRENERIGSSISGNNEFVLYATDAIYSQEIRVLTNSILEDTGLEEAIRKKELSKIIIKLIDCQIAWDIREGHIKLSGWEKKESMFKINKIIEIKVTYEN